MAYQSNQSLEELQAFVAVVEAEGFRSAARTMGGRKATLSARVRDLESRLGVPLLVRTTRSLRLTDEGRAYFEHATRALASARDAEAVVIASKSEPRGTLRVTTSAAMAALVMDKVVSAYLAKYAHARVELHVSERRVDIMRERFDLAVWAGALEDSSLIARKLGIAAGGYYASPRYLARHGEPESPDDLATHDVIIVPKGDAPVEWAFVIGGKEKWFALRPRLAVTDLGLAARAASAGSGIVRSPLALVQPYVAKKQLIAILEKWTPLGLEVYAVFPPAATLVPKTRAFVDMLQNWFDRYEGKAHRR
jgi:DNA-binding transcriptional LysR family regulator